VAAAAALGGLLSVSAVWMNSYAAFSAQTDNPGNSWGTGTVVLADNDTGVKFFTGTATANLKPGDTDEKCIVVTYSGSLAAKVKMYSTGYSQTNGMAGSLDFVIDEGTGGASGGSCTGFTTTGPSAFTGTAAAFGDPTSGRKDFASGVGSDTAMTAGEARSYRIRYTLNPNAPTGVQGGTVNLGFVWEAQNT
jgi:hypothetical protein